MPGIVKGLYIENLIKLAKGSLNFGHKALGSQERKAINENLILKSNLKETIHANQLRGHLIIQTR